MNTVNLSEKRKCRGVERLEFPAITDPRGNLMFAEFPSHLPFQPQRFFVTYGVPVGSVRGEHAHRSNQQIIVCVKGSLTVTVHDGSVTDSYVLDSPDIGIYIPQGVWGGQSHHSIDCVMLVLASEVYDENEYIRSYEDFLDFVKAKESSVE